MANDEKDKEPEVLKTFDMYHFFSRKDVILMIIFILAMIGIILYKTLLTPEIS